MPVNEDFTALLPTSYPINWLVNNSFRSGLALKYILPEVSPLSVCEMLPVLEDHIWICVLWKCSNYTFNNQLQLSGCNTVKCLL